MSGSRFLFPVPNLGVTRVWEVGRVLFHPAGAAAELAWAVEDKMPVAAPSRWRGLLAEKLADFGEAAVAEVAADDVDAAMSEIADALAVLRVVQHMRRPLSDSQRQTFGLPGEVMSARIDYIRISEDLSIGGIRTGASASRSFDDEDHAAWVKEPEFRYLDKALRRKNPDRTALQRRALVTIDLLSQAWLARQPDVVLLNSAIGLEVLLGEPSDRDKKFRVARRVSYFMCGWPGSDRYAAGHGPHALCSSYH